jgi:hypothetical protein
LRRGLRFWRFGGRWDLLLGLLEMREVGRGEMREMVRWRDVDEGQGIQSLGKNRTRMRKMKGKEGREGREREEKQTADGG